MSSQDTHTDESPDDCSHSASDDESTTLLDEVTAKAADDRSRRTMRALGDIRQTHFSDEYDWWS
jgi:hypothetical protein